MMTVGEAARVVGDDGQVVLECCRGHPEVHRPADRWRQTPIAEQPAADVSCLFVDEQDALPESIRNFLKQPSVECVSPPAGGHNLETAA